MPDYKYLIVGGGMTAASAARSIRELDAAGSIGLIGTEESPPYNRPPLSKGLWKGETVDSIWRTTDTDGVEMHLGTTVQHLNPGDRSVTDDTGDLYRYEKLLLATGASPHKLEFGGDSIIYYRSLADYQRLRTNSESGKRFAVIGGGFIGWEIAAALAIAGKEVVHVFPDAGIGARLFPADLAHFLCDFYTTKGVEVLAGSSIEGLEVHAGKPVIHVRNKRSDGRADIAVDGVIAGAGVHPNVQLARDAGLMVENGIRVDNSLRTSEPTIYAAGDVASVYNSVLDRWMRVEHEDCANTMGAFAGAAMAGRAGSYDYLPFFYSDLFELGFEAVGDLDSRMETFADWKEPFKEGVVYYLKEERVRGVLLWNVWDSVDAARKLIAEPGPFSASNLKGRIPA